ncbi:MAG: hypothetical protein ACFBZ8_11890 [Opitutales bacterium]
MNLAIPGVFQDYAAAVKRSWQRRPRLTPPAASGPVHLDNRDFAFIANLDATRRRFLLEKTVYGLALILGVLATSLSVRCSVDWWLEMPWLLRFCCLAAEALFACGCVYRYLIWPRRHPPSDEAVALLIEKHHKDLRSRLISTLQLNQPGKLGPAESPTLVRALTRQTEAHAADLKFSKAISMQQANRLALRALAISAFLATALFLSGDTGMSLLRRAVLSTEPVPRKTRIEILTERHVIGLGDDIALRARASGLVPDAGEVRIEYASGRTQRISMKALEDTRDTFERVVLAVPEPFNYTVYLGDARSEVQRVRTRDKPAIRSIQARYQPPAYTGVQARTISLQDLKVLPGSQLIVSGTSGRSLSGGTILPRGIAGSFQMTPDPNDPARSQGTLPIPTEGLRGFSVHLLDADGVPSPESPVYPVRIVVDRAPTVEVVFPVQVQQLVTPSAKLLLSFRASDDYRIGSVALKYSIDNGPTQTEELDLGPTPGALENRRYDWDLEQLAQPLEQGDLIQFWFEVADTNTVTGPSTNESRRFVARVVSREEKAAELASRVADSVGSISEVATGQRTSNAQLGEFIQRKESGQ